MHVLRRWRKEQSPPAPQHGELRWELQGILGGGGYLLRASRQNYHSPLRTAELGQASQPTLDHFSSNPSSKSTESGEKYAVNSKLRAAPVL